MLATSAAFGRAFVHGAARSLIGRAVLLATLVIAMGAPVPRAAAAAAAAAPANTVPVPSYMFIHDPSMIREDNTWYLFSTGDPNGGVNDGDIQIRESTDLRTWHLVGTVFRTIPSWITNRVLGVQSLWAPDISYYGGLYHLYYAASSFGANDSLIALATNRTLDPSSA